MASEIQKKIHRRGWIDYARGIVIIYVVYRHALTGLISAGVDIRNAIYMVQESSMPIFFIVSGVFIYSSATKRGLGDFVRFKFESLIYPYLVWGSIHLVAQIIFSQYSNADKDWGYFVYLVTYPRAIDQFWYLYTLFAVMVLFVALNFVILKFREIPNIIVAVLLYLVSFIVQTDQFSINDILFYYLFLAFGFIVAKYILPIESNFFKGKWLWYGLPALVLLLVYWYTHYSQIRFLVDLNFAGFLLFVPITILGALFLFVVVNKLEESKILLLFKQIGSHSLYIYVMHLMIAGASRVMIMKLFPTFHPIAILLLIILAGVAIPIGIYKILMALRLSWLFAPPPFVKRIIFFGSKPQ